MRRVARVQLGADVLARQVEAHRQLGLEQQPGARGLGDDLAVDLDPHRSRAPADVDAVERVARVAGDPLVLLVPLVEGGEVEHHVAGEVLVGEPEPGARAVADRDGLARGRVHAERDPRVQHAGDLAVGRRRRRQLGADVLGRHGVGRDTRRGSQTRIARVLSTTVSRAEARPHALLDRLVPESGAVRGHQRSHPAMETGTRAAGLDSLSPVAPRPERAQKRGACAGRRRPPANRGAEI